MEVAKAVGQKLKDARKLKGLTQKEVSAVLNIYFTQYQKYESGFIELDYRKMIEICKLFEVSADYLLGLSDI